MMNCLIDVCKKSKFLFALIGSLLVSCGEPDPVEPQGVEVLKVKVDDSFLYGGRNWIIISDHEGNFVTYKSIKSGDTFSIWAEEGKLADKMTVTTLRFSNSSSRNKSWFWLESYTDVAVGSDWKLQRLDFPPSPRMFDVRLSFMNSVPEAQRLNYSSWSSRVMSADKTAENEFHIYITRPIEDLFISLTGNEEPRYKLFDLSEGREFTTDIKSEFGYFDEVLPVKLVSPKLNLRVLAYDFDALIDRGGHLQAAWYDRSDGDLLVGFNEGYQQYKTEWSAETEAGWIYDYQKIGTPPTASSFEMPDLNFSISDVRINSFDFASESEFTWHEGNWIRDFPQIPDEPYITWQVVRPVESRQPVLKGLGGKLAEEFPEFNGLIAGLVHLDSKFTRQLDGQSYEEMLNNKFGENPFRSETETISLTK